MAAGEMDFQLQFYSGFKPLFFLFRAVCVYTVCQITAVRRETAACEDAYSMLRVRTADQIQNCFGDSVGRLGVTEDPVVVIAGDIVDMDLPRHGKERVGVLFAEVPDFRSDVMFGEIHSCVQDKTAGTPAEQFADEVREPSVRRLLSHSGGNDQLAAVQKAGRSNVFRHIDPVHETVQTVCSADQFQLEHIFCFRINILQ